MSEDIFDSGTATPAKPGWLASAPTGAASRERVEVF